MLQDRTVNVARGKWRGILLQLGIPEMALRNKHGPCPLCGQGTDRFRFDDKDGNGTWFCNKCGAGDGMKLAIAYTGKTFREVAALIDGMVGNIKYEPVRQERSPEQALDLLRDTWRETREVKPGDVVHRYLASRGVDELIYPAALRFAPNLRDGEGGIRPCMVAMVGVYGSDKFVSMHRTFLKPDGSGKADMPSPRKMMPGALPDGACVALSDFSGGTLGIAEGIETAMSASALYGLPVWAALNTTMLQKWTPPEGCDEVAIFGDNDASFGGQAAAYGLAYRLAGKVPVNVHIPDAVGEDWNDVWQRHRKGRKSA